MKWTDDHDIILGKEILLVKPYQFKPGSKERGNYWTTIVEDLNNISEIDFNVTQKAVRDRYRNLLEKHKRKMRKEEGASGSNDKDTELDNLLQDIKEESDEADSTYDKQTKEKLKNMETDKNNAEDVRQKAMESLAETKKRKQIDDSSSCSSKRNNGSETMLYLKVRAEQETNFRQQDLKLRRQELKLKQEKQEQQQQQQTLFHQQMVQQQQLMLAMFNKLVEKDK